jgi:hypothetical protein
MAKNHFTALELILDSGGENEKQLLEGVFEKTGLACIAGASDTGKSMILRDLALAISQEDESFLGFKLNLVHNKVIFVSTEDSKSMTSKYLRTQTEGLIDDSLKRIRFIFNPENVLTEIETLVKEEPVDLVITDCWGDIFMGNSINSNEVRGYLNKLQRLSEEYNFLSLSLHHTNKRSEFGAPSKHNINGGQAFQAKMRTVVELRRDPRNEDIRHFCIVKGNYLKESQKNKSFILHFDQDNLRFTSKGERAEYDSLYEKDIDYSKINKYQSASDLKKSGLRNKDIAAQLECSEPTISRLLKEGQSKGWDNLPPDEEDPALVEFA